MPIATATAFPSPISSSSSGSTRLVIAYTVAIVPTTFSLAINPVIAAAASCQAATPTIGIRRTAKGPAIEASIDVSSAPSSTAWKLQLKLCII